ncbi:cation:proton antiporter [Embleya scabrispora]|uniref:cation:proton antiporter n=1 Tax=Embleya scabrispora TaxID=159449 RepID=UPI000373C0E1|nr:cation:proton antiporter [Embleya scabrispora]MYS79263.1 cation/H(+) antiporter [Streptomyces sp. SID5474]
MTSHQLLLLLLQITVLLACATVLGRLAMRCGMPTVVGELVVGVLVGPSVFGALAPGMSHWLWSSKDGQPQLLEVITQFGVLLFVGVAAAHLDVPMLRRRRRTIATIGGSALLIPLTLGVTTGCLLPRWLVGPEGNRTTFALLVGVVMAVSAIPVMAKTLTDLNMMHRDVGQLMLASAAVDDVVAWLILSLVSGMTVSGYSGSALVLNVAHLIAFVLAAALVMRPLARAALRVADRVEGPGPTIATAVALILGGSAAALSLGLEAALGAFAVGIVISSRGAVDVTKLAPLRTLVLAVFAPLFLASAGLRMEISVLADPGVALIAVLVCALAIVVKLGGGYLGARLSRLTHREGLAIGAGLNARGAVEVVVATIGLRIGVLSEAMYTIVILVAVVTSVTAPPILRWAMARVEQVHHERLREIEMTAWS